MDQIGGFAFIDNASSFYLSYLIENPQMLTQAIPNPTDRVNS